MEIQKTKFAFYCSVDLSNKLVLAADLQSIAAGRFDGEPLLIPSPENAPESLPQIVLRAKDGSASLQVASSRVDVIIGEPVPAEKSISSLIEREKDFICSIVQVLADSKGVNGMVHRIGAIYTLASTVQLDELNAVRARYFQPDMRLGERQFDFGLLDRKVWGAFEINRWLRIKFGPRRGNEDSESVLEVNLDVNTLPTKEYEFDGSLAATFFELTKENADQEVELD